MHVFLALTFKLLILSFITEINFGVSFTNTTMPIQYVQDLGVQTAAIAEQVEVEEPKPNR